MKGLGNSMKQKVMIGSLSAALLFGAGIAGTVQKAWAAESAGTQTAGSPAAAADKVNPLDARIRTIVGDTAYVSWKSEGEIRSALADGKTLLEAAGLSSDDLTGRLARLVFGDIDSVLESGSLTAEEAEVLKRDAAAKLENAVSVPGYRQKDAEYFKNLVADTVLNSTAILSDKDQSDLQDSLMGGSSLAEASGLGVDSLAAMLIDSYNRSIDDAVARLELASDEVETVKKETADWVKEVLRTKGYVPASRTGADAMIRSHLQAVTLHTAELMDADLGDVTAALDGGRSLAEISGFGAGGLLTKLAGLAGSDLDAAAAAGRLTAEQAAEAKQQAEEQLKAVIQIGGYGRYKTEEDLSRIVRNRLENAVRDAAILTEKEISDVRASVAGGAALAEAVGLTQPELTEKLAALAADDLARLGGPGNTELKQQALEEATRQLKELVGLKGYQSDRELADYSYLIYNRLSSQMEDAAILADKSVSELKDAVSRGMSLAQAAGMEAGELKDQLTGLAYNDIHALEAAGKITPAEAAKLKALADRLIR